MIAFRRLTLCLVFSLVFGSFAVAEPNRTDSTKRTAPMTAQASKQPVKDMIQRLAPGHADRFDLVALQPADTSEMDISAFEIRAGEGDRIVLAGTSPAEQAAAFGWYLKYVAQGHVSRAGDRIPEVFPQPNESISRTSPYRYRFVHNYTVHGYQSPFWGFAEWEREIDLLASAGVNQLLVIAGTERVWEIFLKELGYPEDRIRAFIAHPVYAAWWHMGNLEGEGGPVSDALIERQVDLGQRVVRRCHELGITPVVQGFVGLLPHDADQFIDGIRVVPQGTWLGYQRPTVLDPTHESFPRVAQAWYRAVETVYGPGITAFAGDLFHEGGKHGDLDLTASAKAVQDAMNRASPGSLWIIQSWQSNPVPPLVAGTQPEQTAILQLDVDMRNNPDASPRRGYQDRPWLWAEVNGGGNRAGLYGGMHLLANMPAKLKDPAFAPGDVAGIASMAEGLDQNPVFYDLFFELAWHHEPIDLEQWTEAYVRRRYGSAPPAALRAWSLLMNSVYNPTLRQGGCTESILCAKPNRNARKASSWGAGSILYYDVKDVLQAAEALLAAAPELDATAETYRYDVVDVVRQVLADTARPQLRLAFDHADVAGVFPDSVAKFEVESQRYLELIEMTDEILATHPKWLLDYWLAPAKRMGESQADRDQAVMLAKRIITTWNDRNDGLDDYGHRQFAGLMKDYYLPRWQAYMKDNMAVLRGEQGYDYMGHWYRKHRGETDLAYAQMQHEYPSQTQGDTLKAARRILDQVGPRVEALFVEQPKDTEFPWALKERKETFVIDVTGHLNDAGVYTANFQWRRGRSALKIHSVALYEDDTKLVEDRREGWTGTQNRLNTYVLPLPKQPDYACKYTIRAEVSAASSGDSAGVMTLRQRGGFQQSQP